MRRVIVLTDQAPRGTSILNSIPGYSFKFVRTITNKEAADVYVVDNTYGVQLRKGLPYNVRSFYFPVYRLADDQINGCIDVFYGALAKDQTIFTRRYNYIDETFLPTQYGEFVMFGFKGRTNGKTILGLRTANIPAVPAIRTHSMCYTGDIFHSLRCDCREEFENALHYIQKHGGMLVYPLEEGRGIGVLNKISVYNSQHAGYDTVDAQYINGHPNDLRDYDYLKNVLEHYGVNKANLITNNPLKALGLEMAGIELADCIKLKSTVNEYNRGYLMTKMTKNKHNFTEELGGVS